MYLLLLLELGGAYHATESVAIITRGTFTSNIAQHGGAIGLQDYSTLSLFSSSCTGNAVRGVGGCMYSGDSDFLLDDCLINYNAAADRGGAIYANQLDFVITNSELSNNNAYEGL